MPTITETPIAGYAHCRNPRCSGSRQEEVPAIRRTNAYTYVERGGDLPGIEGSQDYIVFADVEQTPCPNCGHGRDISESPRPSYEALSGFSQDGLLDIEINPNGLRFDPQKQAEIQAESNEQMATENAELREQVAELRGMVMAQMAGKQVPTPEPEED